MKGIFKILSFVLLIVLIFGSLALLSFNYYKDNYHSQTIYVSNLDDYGEFSYEGKSFSFKGKFYCDNGTYIYSSDLVNYVNNKNLDVEYRVTDEGDNKIEKFWLGSVVCEKNGGKNNKEE